MGPTVDAEGFAIRSGVLSEAECGSLAQAFSAEGGGRAGIRRVMGNPQVNAMAHDPRLRSLAGGGVPFRATLFNKTSRANWLIPWHQDTALPLSRKFDDSAWGPWSCKGGVWYSHAPEWALRQVVALRVHLDGSTLDNGPLRVIPGSHHKLLTDAEVEAAAQLALAVDCVVPRGGVIAIRPLIIHASSKIVNDLPRRVLHIEYVVSLTLREGVELRVV